MSVLEEIDAGASLLPPDFQAEVLDFIEFLDYKKAKNQAVATGMFLRLPKKRGAGKAIILYVADDFDAPSDDLGEYMY